VLFACNSSCSSEIVSLAKSFAEHDDDEVSRRVHGSSWCWRRSAGTPQGGEEGEHPATFLRLLGDGVFNTGGGSSSYLYLWFIEQHCESEQGARFGAKVFGENIEFFPITAEEEGEMDTQYS
jgi:hypothetical protein